MPEEDHNGPEFAYEIVWREVAEDDHRYDHLSQEHFDHDHGDDDGHEDGEHADDGGHEHDAEQDDDADWEKKVLSNWDEVRFIKKS